MINDGKYIYIIDMGSHHTTKLIAAVAQLGHYVTAKHYSKIDRNTFMGISEDHDGLIISGSMRNIGDDDFPNLPFVKLPNLPLLAICYGMQLIGHKKGVNIVPCNQGLGEKGEYELEIVEESILWEGFDQTCRVVYHYHENMLEKVPEGWIRTSATKDCPIASIEKENKYFCTQFHPECNEGTKNVMIKNFIEHIC
jgi:GMP synthase (glutamine-hydrolysing)|tara:strand:- start:2703 stop:3290 length:588 start_codon:yes stop_codon:yes gene_type:complete